VLNLVEPEGIEPNCQPPYNINGNGFTVRRREQAPKKRIRGYASSSAYLGFLSSPARAVTTVASPQKLE
jgi:3-deoxy-D-arabino-heptulosonate 7-phosphate (DAHP) synthase class II